MTPPVVCDKQSKPAPYPARPQFFACKFVRQLTNRYVANELGPQVFTLLTVVAMTEDARGYTGAVTFYNAQLAPLIGVGSEDALDRVRKKCIQAGWLFYVPGGRWHGPGRYWVTIPERYVGSPDWPSDEPEEGESVHTSAEQGAEQDETKTRARCGANREQGADHFLPGPAPTPSPDPAQHAAHVVGAADGPAPSGQPKRKGKRKPTGRFVPPTVGEVEAYCAERMNGIDAQRFVDHYTAKGWMIGKNKVKDWEACVRTWEKNEREWRPTGPETLTEAANRSTDDFLSNPHLKVEGVES